MLLEKENKQLKRTYTKYTYINTLSVQSEDRTNAKKKYKQNIEQCVCDANCKLEID